MSQAGSGHLGSTVPELLSLRSSASPDDVAYRLPGPAPREVRWSEHEADVDALAAALTARGIARGHRVGILAPTSLGWETAQMAVLKAGGVVVGLDPNYPDAELQHLAASIGLDALFVQDATFVSRVFGDRLPDILVVGLVPAIALSSAVSVTIDQLLLESCQGKRRTTAGPSPNDDAIVVFSSGTTGRPKPIAYTHAQVMLAVEALAGAFPDLNEDSRLLCWLPLANLFQRMINFCAIARGAASTMVSDPRTVMDHMEAASPHLFVGVPRFFERVHSGIRERLAAGSWFTSMVGRWAIDTGSRRVSARRNGAQLRWSGALAAAAADLLVLKRLRRVFGRDARYLLSGSAPMPTWLLEFYEAIGLPIYEAYGVSENIVPVAMNRPHVRKVGTVGKPLPDNDVVIASDGEIRVRGAGVFRGYWNALPTDPAPDAEGYWSTGDLGAFDEQGWLRIQGRKADVFKLSTGRWVAPGEIEARLRRVAHVEHALAFGEGRKVVVAVLSVPAAAVSSSSEGTEARSASIGSDVAEAVAELPAHERPAGVLVVREAFGIASGELTTNLKVRRKAVWQKYSARIEQLYAELDTVRANPSRSGGESVLVRSA